MVDNTPTPEPAILVVAGLKSDVNFNVDSRMDELALLAESAQLLVVGVTHQKLTKVVPATYIGSGKIRELAQLRDQTKATYVVIDSRLSGIQQRNLSELIGCRVVDRHQLILEIFAQRANTREGKLQVELAQLKDQLPRLIGEAIAGLSRLAGGIGTRGPGETKLEMDRRRISTRIEKLEAQIEAVRKTRELHRSRRKKTRVPLIALTGYTNSGKSTLLNRMTKSEVFTEDKLFATLDPTTRKLRLPSGRMTVATDTVGFISHLPHHLVEAFKATFEEVSEADIILFVHDGSHPEEALHTKVVMDLLKGIGADQKPIIHVYNKHDLVENIHVRNPQRLHPFVNVSALTGKGLDSLFEAIEHQLDSLTKEVDLYLPSADPSLVYELAREVEILEQEQGPNIIHCRVKITDEALQRWSSYLESEE